MARCRYCGKSLAEDGFCSKPCIMGKLLRTKNELIKKLEEERKAKEN